MTALGRLKHIIGPLTCKEHACPVRWSKVHRWTQSATFRHRMACFLSQKSMNFLFRRLFDINSICHFSLGIGLCQGLFYKVECRSSARYIYNLIHKSRVSSSCCSRQRICPWRYSATPRADMFSMWSMEYWQWDSFGDGNDGHRPSPYFGVHDHLQRRKKTRLAQPNVQTINRTT